MSRPQFTFVARADPPVTIVFNVIVKPFVVGMAKLTRACRDAAAKLDALAVALEDDE